MSQVKFSGRIFAFNLHLLHLIKAPRPKVCVFLQDPGIICALTTPGKCRLKIQYGHTPGGVSVMTFYPNQNFMGLLVRYFFTIGATLKVIA